MINSNSTGTNSNEKENYYVKSQQSHLSTLNTIVAGWLAVVVVASFIATFLS